MGYVILGLMVTAALIVVVGLIMYVVKEFINEK